MLMGEILEQFINVAVKLPFNNIFDLVIGYCRIVILQVCKFIGYLIPDDVGTGTHQLAQFDEGGSQVLKHQS